MNLLEYQAKRLLRMSDVPTPNSWLLAKDGVAKEPLEYPVVLKSQVPVGGRGKAGGIIVVHDDDERLKAFAKLMDLSIKGYRPTRIFAEQVIEPKRELYLSLRINRDARQLEWLVSNNGGVDIEENAEQITAVPYGPEASQTIASTLGLDPSVTSPLVESITDCFQHNDLTLCEINPLFELEDGAVVCGDAKTTIDDNARFRQPSLPWPAEQGNHPVALGGTIGCIANGAGMAMSTMDTIVSAGGHPANFLDIGGGTGEKEFVLALQEIIHLPDVTSVIINIFAGISRCDEIARGIIAANKQFDHLPPLFIRLEGTNRDKAVELLREASIVVEADLKSCVHKALEVTS